MAFHNTQFPTTISYRPVGGPRFKTRIVTNPGGNEQRNINWVTQLGKWRVDHKFKSQTEIDELKSFFKNQYGRAHTFRFRDPADYKARMVSTEDLPVIYTTVGSPDIPNTQLVKNYTSGGYTYARNITLPVGTNTTYTIGAVDTGAETFTIGGSDYTANFGAGVAFRVSGSTANDSIWVVDSSTFSGGNTVITVTGNITDATVDGNIIIYSGTVLLYADTVLISDSNYYVDYSTGIIYWVDAWAPGVGVAITAYYEFDVLARFDSDEFDSSMIPYFDGAENASSWEGVEIVEVRA